MKRLIKAVFLFIAGCSLAAFAVANRHIVRFVADPLPVDRETAYSFEAPLFVYLFCALFSGLVIGSTAMWFTQGRWRKAARKSQKDAAVWKREAENLKRGLTATPFPAIPLMEKSRAA